MADGNPLHLPDDKKGQLVPASGFARLPLLPFEKHLIDILGCTEEEYRWFAAEAKRRGMVRPAEYAGIPDVRNEAATVLAIISLVVGLASTALSLLMQPKISGRQEGGVRRLASRTGPDRFSQTTGFDSLAELADYNTPIPIIFGRRNERAGGMLVTPSLVWSRAFSYGYQQGIKMLFVVGEQGLGRGIEPPALQGVFLGNTPLDSMYQHSFALYWKRGTNERARVNSSNLVAGTRGTQSSGDTQDNDDIFTCPTIRAVADTGFCHSYTPTSNTSFGAYSAIPNGTDYRVNFVLKSVENIRGDGNDAHDRSGARSMLQERIKIAGDYSFERTGTNADRYYSLVWHQGQAGVGRGYSCRMGIVRYQEQQATGNRETFVAQVGHRIVFSIHPGNIPQDTYYEEVDGERTDAGVEDINNEIQALRERADDLLQVGETFIISGSVWVVESRTREVFTNQRQDITLRCIEVLADGQARRIGIINEQFITEWLNGDDLQPRSIGPSFYPLLRVNFGIVRNTRACEITEIGIKSQVWNRANGLCNFNSLVTPEQLIRLERKAYAVQSGVMNTFMKRSSLFTIFVRPAGVNASGEEYEWVPIGEEFNVNGENNIDKYNFIRIQHPDLRRYEFRFVPRPGAYVQQNIEDTSQLWTLNAASGPPISGTYTTAYGNFVLSSRGYIVTKSGITFNPEMMQDPRITREGETRTIPSGVAIERYLPDDNPIENRPTELEFNANDYNRWFPRPVSGAPAPGVQGQIGCFLYEMLGQPNSLNETRRVTRRFELGGNRTITVEFVATASVDLRGLDHYTGLNGSGNRQNFRWVPVAMNPVAAQGHFVANENIDLIAVTSANNPWRQRTNPAGVNSPTGVTVRVVSVRGTEVYGRQQAFEYELFGAATAAGTTGTRTIDTTVNGRALRLTARSTVVPAGEFERLTFPTEQFMWGDTTYTVDESGTDGTWRTGETVDVLRTVGAGNIFRPVGSSVGVRLRVTGLRETTTSTAVRARRQFEEASRIADVSHYPNLLQKSNESGPEHEIVYVNEMRQNPAVPEYTSMTLSGLAIKASRTFNKLDQIRFWLAEGVKVRKFQANAGNDPAASEMFCDLVYYLLTDRTAGVGASISEELIDTSNFEALARFYDANMMYFNGVISEPTNIRQFIYETAPYFLTNFTIAEGRFGLRPALPIGPSGTFATTTPIQGLFTAGNILEDSFAVTFFNSEERKDFQAVVRFRQERSNQLPEERTVNVRWAEEGGDTYPIESFDLTRFCTNREHAEIVGKYLLSIRRRITHSVRFKTSPYGLQLAPGDYIRVNTTASPYSPANNGVVDASGNVTSATTLSDGQYQVIYYLPPEDQTQESTMTIANGRVVEPALYNSIFTLVTPTNSANVYSVDQISLDEEGMVEIVATEFPCLPNTTTSAIVNDLQLDGQFTVEG